MSEEVETLHIYPAGAVPENPADLLLNETVGLLFETVEAQV